MKKTLFAFFLIVEKLNRFLYYISAGAILLAAVILTYEVTVRYVLTIPTIWEIEASIYLGIFATFIGAAYGLKDEAHINMGFIVEKLLTTNQERKLSTVTSFISLLFCVFVAYHGWLLWYEAFSRGWKTETLWGPPMAIPYFFLPLGFTLLSLQFIFEFMKKSPYFTDALSDMSEGDK